MVKGRESRVLLLWGSCSAAMAVSELEERERGG